MKAINKVALIGGGPMGGVVVAHLANAGVKVLWLSYRKAADHNALTGAIEKMLKTSPAPFMSKGAAKLIEVGNIDDDLGRVAECDWVIEAIMERLDVKQSFLSQAGRRAAAGNRGVQQHLDDPAREADRGNARDLPARLHDHALLQPDALHAALGSGSRS